MKTIFLCMLGALALSGCVAEYPDDSYNYAGPYDRDHYWHHDNDQHHWRRDDSDEEHHYWHRDYNDD